MEGGDVYPFPGGGRGGQNVYPYSSLFFSVIFFLDFFASLFFFIRENQAKIRKKAKTKNNDK
ncbi:MAG: hypothetical protein CL798_07345 [Chromatiales bacterium]|nr:hypothetical protein [Chromatiales bacterium]